MIALLQNEFIEKKKWLEKDEFTDVIAVAESTPGPIAINCSTYIGYKIGGFLGSLIATLAVCIPSFTIIYVVSLFFDAFISLEYVALAFKGIRVCVTFLILSAGLKLFLSAKKSAFNLIIFGVTAATVVTLSLFAVNFSSIYLILIAAAVGVIAYLITSARSKVSAKSSDEIPVCQKVSDKASDKNAVCSIAHKASYEASEKSLDEASESEKREENE